MAKLSDIFGRKPEGDTDKIIPLPAMPLRGNGPGEPAGERRAGLNDGTHSPFPVNVATSR